MAKLALSPSANAWLYKKYLASFTFLCIMNNAVRLLQFLCKIELKKNLDVNFRKKKRLMNLKFAEFGKYFGCLSYPIN